MESLLGPDPVQREAQPASVLVLWLPAFLMAGMGSYFALAEEPAKFVLLALCAGSVVLAAITGRWQEYPLWRWVVAASVGVTCGLVLAQHRTTQMATPLLTERAWNVTLDGTVQSAERAGLGWTVVLRDVQLQGKPDTKYTLRLSLRKRGEHYTLGDRLQVVASLLPPSPPLIPGMFDFQRHAYFDGISGYGYVTRVLVHISTSGVQERSALEQYREWLSARVYNVLQQPEAGIVTALLNGQRAGITRATTNGLQISGLQHIISISGLHVGLMAGVVFYVVRLLLACNMRLALQWPIKKIAAAVAMTAIILYMFVVGLSPATVRSVIMTSIVLLAVMVDREAINLRLVAIAAMIILILQPESVLDIGFQLSFAAVVGLVAFFQLTQRFWKHEVWQNSIVMKMLRVLLISVVTSLIATLATAPLTLAHFQKIPILSMLANVLASPLVALLIMPGTFLAYLLTPLQALGEWPIRMMGYGVTGLLHISDFIGHMPSALWRTAAPPFGAVTLMMVGIYFLLVVNK